jgi:hypothetical protein
LSQEENKIKADYLNNIDKVDRWISTASENGLFKEQTYVSFDVVIERIKSARESLMNHNPPDYVQSDYELSKAAKFYFDAVDHTSAKWRFQNIYAGHVWIYFIGMLSVVFLFYYFDVGQPILQKFSLLRVAIDATSWGVVGGILQGLWALWRNVDLRQYRKPWQIRFISAPFIGGILGAIVYLLVVGGLLIISKEESAEANLNAVVIMALAALAGYNWEWAVKQFNKIGERFSS